MRLVIKQLAILAAIGTLLIFLLSYLGAYVPLGDSLAVIRIPMALFGMLFIIALRRSWVFVAVVATSALILLDTWIDRSKDTGPAGDYVLYQKNLLFRNTAFPELAADIRAHDADFVTLQEVSNLNLPFLDLMREDYPYQQVCQNRRVTGTAVLSRHPIGPERGMCSDWRAFAALQVVTPDGLLWVVSQHLFWPYPKLQHAQIERIVPKYKSLNGPIILGGDFNMLPNTRVESVIAKAVDATPLRPNFTTLWAGPLPVSIDQILARCGVVERRPLLGSDHHGLVGRVGFDQETCRE